MAATHYQIFCRYYHSAVNKAVINDIHVAQPVGWRQKEDLVKETSEIRNLDPDNAKYKYRTSIIDYYGGTEGSMFASNKMTNDSDFENGEEGTETEGRKKLFFKVDKDYLDNDVCRGSMDGKFKYEYMAIENVWVRFEDFLLAQDSEGVSATDKQIANLSAARSLDTRLNEIITEESSSDNPKYDMVFIYDGISQEEAGAARNASGSKYSRPTRVWTYYGNKLWKLPKKYRMNDNALRTYFNADEPTDIATDLHTLRYNYEDYSDFDRKIVKPGVTEDMAIGRVAEEGFISTEDFSNGIKVIADPAEFNTRYNVRFNSTDAYAPQSEPTNQYTVTAVKTQNSKTWNLYFDQASVPAIGQSDTNVTVYYFLTVQEAQDLLLGVRSSITVTFYIEDGATSGNYTRWSERPTYKLRPDDFVKSNASITGLQLYTYNTENQEVKTQFDLEEMNGERPKVYYEKFKRFEFSPWFVYSNCGSLKQAMIKAEELVNIVGIDNLIIGKVVDLTQYIELA